MRCWDDTGQVRTAAWENAEALLPQAHAVVLSEEDVGSSEALITDWAGRTRVLAVTRGAAGCTVYAAGTTWNLSGFPAAEVDPTGSGDIFAGVFFTRLWKGDDPPTAAQLANCIAAISVTRSGLSGTPTPEEVAHCRGLCV
jgi:sugar/nucleoside kinase (ribokinase family)